MKMLLKIAWRNIWRSKLRSLVVILAISFGLVGGLFASAWMNGMAIQQVNNTFSFETAHIQIHNPKFEENLNVKKVITDTDEKINNLLKIDGVLGVTSRLKIAAMASTASKNIGVTVVGVNLKSEKEVFGLYKKIDTSSGNYFKTTKRNSIVVSKALAKKLKVKLKSKIVLTFQDYNGQLTGAAFKIIGIFKTNNSSWDKTHVFVNNVDFRNLLVIPDNASHEIDIKLNDYKKAAIIATQLQKKYHNLLIKDWSKIKPYISFLTDYMDIMMGVFMIIILGALGFGIVNTMLMVILERTKELGMLMAIGMNKKRIFITIMFETVLLSLVGAILGEIISMFLIKYFGVVGIDISSLAEGLESVGYSAITYPILEPIRYLQITILVIITGILASVYPAIKALKLDPAEAIRTV
jgi:ABC-type lipoprotein release transport system permease subunit